MKMLAQEGFHSRVWWTFSRVAGRALRPVRDSHRAREHSCAVTEITDKLIESEPY